MTPHGVPPQPVTEPPAIPRGEPRPPGASLPVVSAGLSVSRQLTGAGLVILGLPALTALLVHDRANLPLATPVLLMLLLVVMGALVGGLRVGLPAALVGALVLNWFFTVPYGTLAVYQPDHLLVLLV